MYVLICKGVVEEVLVVSVCYVSGDEVGLLEVSYF